MDKKDKTFDEKLLELEKPNPSYKEKYEKEKKKMFEKKLTLFGRLLYALLGFISFLFGLFYIKMGILIMRQMSTSSWTTLFTLGVICLVFSGLATLIVVKGTIKLKSYPMAIACMLFAFVIIMLAGVMGRGIKQTDPLSTIQTVIYGIVFLLVTSLLIILNRIQQSEYHTREKLLQIELHMASISEKIEAKSPDK